MAAGLLIRRHREGQGLSRDELARKAGIPPMTIYRVETGRLKNPLHETKVALAEALGVPIEVLFGHTDEPQPAKMATPTTNGR